MKSKLSLSKDKNISRTIKLTALLYICSGALSSVWAQSSSELCAQAFSELRNTSTYTMPVVETPDMSLTFQELEQNKPTFAVPKSENLITHTMGLTVGEFSYEVKTKISRQREPRTGGVCLRPTFAAQLGFTDLKVYLAKELTQFNCLRKTTLDHENRHVAINKKNLVLLNSYAQSLLDEVSVPVYFSSNVPERDQIRYVEELQQNVSDRIKTEYDQKSLAHYDFDKVEYARHTNSTECLDEKKQFIN